MVQDGLDDVRLHPEVGLLKLDYTYLWLGQRLGTRMTTYTPADEVSAAKLRQLSDREALLIYGRLVPTKLRASQGGRPGWRIRSLPQHRPT